MMSTQSNSKGVAVVTGSAQGIGRSIAIRLAGDGYDVVINDLESNKENLEEVKKEIAVNFPERRVLSVLGNVSVEEDVKGLVESAVKEFGRLNVVATSDDFESMLSVNVKGTFYSYKYAAQQMIAQGEGGRIIGASSLAGKKGLRSLSAYCASKFAVRGLTQSAAVELGRNGITVNAYAPGTIQTPMLAEFTGSADNNDIYEKFKQMTAVGDIGTTQDISSLVSFLVIPEARFITGISIDGGIFFD
ncbi:hypothetical protein DFJ58DRAFT_801956 [Suillus subalutaceus]|uniref:uncharacterized protein n=1 Tax=Suillus subalutaceus TaxID=48586 RepID=UPI001B86D491|nr:uncharacterized protein DFJ58DRAFT_801956 [Suillus subalutaceus]KAG1844819.1 hypothetical protein DFJ58DRAFT_801956 [Suillus subalutaceus]